MRMLKKGDSGRDVQTLQTALKISADGQFGPLTEKAVVRFQLSNNFPVTGIVESPMWVLLLNQPILILDEIDEDTDISEEYFTTNFDQVIHRHFLPKGEYLEGPIKNEYIFLHHTAGNNNPYRTIDHWGRDKRGRVATEFVLGGNNHRNGDSEYNGVMVQAFPEKGQGWHLGRTGSGWMNRHSVGLEICSMGYLNDDDKTYVESRCTPNEITVLEKPFKGYTKWQRYTPEQIKATEKWIRYIGERDEIDIRKGLQQFIKDHGPYKGFDFQEDAFYGKVKGLLTHTNVRRDKWDCYPNPDFVDMIMSL
ncbi:MAG: hypothetical protein ACI81I_000650 [Arcobacteraceae bacterium]|jgi:hypothetical protein|tara:strand:- start:1036 stop:1956 length:921 start_codon:yes stop_codon:yes gene_type:complete